MKRNLVHDRQPFGEVHSSYQHPSTMGDDPIHRKALGAEMEIGVNAKNHPPAIQDPSYGYDAYKMASRHRDHPFYCTGHPKGGI